MAAARPMVLTTATFGMPQECSALEHEGRVDLIGIHAYPEQAAGADDVAPADRAVVEEAAGRAAATAARRLRVLAEAARHGRAPHDPLPIVDSHTLAPALHR